MFRSSCSRFNYVTGRETVVESYRRREHGAAPSCGPLRIAMTTIRSSTRPTPRALILADRLAGEEIAIRKVPSSWCYVEPGKRIELLTYALQVRCSTD